jgi:23S rRNA pseudouridine1911/1915/1917 synthase
MQDSTDIHIKQQVPRSLKGYRLDQAAARIFTEYSRGRLQKWIRDGHLYVDGRPGKVREKLLGGEWLTLQAELESENAWPAQALDLDIVYEDNTLLVINKPAGLIVHPGAGNPDLTLLNGLLHHCPQLEVVPRAGIVHRLDKDTTGLLVVAKTLTAHHSLVNQLKARSVSRQYEAIVQGEITRRGTIDEPIGRHPTARIRMAVTRGGGKPAVTHYQVITRYPGYSHLRVILETGRTHQIRVHMSHIGHPLVGDPLYGGRLRIPAGISEPLAAGLRGFDRQALHAAHLALLHPESGKTMVWKAALPQDMQDLLALFANATVDRGVARDPAVDGDNGEP